MSSSESLNADEDQLAFRACLGQFATGVTVVTCSGDGGQPCGITANSFSSVSLDPPLVLWNIAKSSNSLQAFLDASHFGVHILSEDQLPLSIQFSKSDHTLFNGVRFEKTETGIPLLPGCLATFECSTHRIHDSGDHHIIVGHVDRFRWERGDPLLFFSGRYRQIGDSAD